VGNLPPGTDVADLKDHFSRGATNSIESVFLISKSNCAFVNYKTESACTAAMTRFHDSRFQGVRLVCRLRRGSAAAPGSVHAGPALASTSGEAIEQIVAGDGRSGKQAARPETGDQGTSAEEPSASIPRVPEKYFIVKSLTVEDLEMSVRNGVWATQAHNEANLNKAYEVPP
jgi:RNA recognition motif-containing protein